MFGQSMLKYLNLTNVEDLLSPGLKNDPQNPGQYIQILDAARKQEEQTKKMRFSHHDVTVAGAYFYQMRRHYNVMLSGLHTERYGPIYWQKRVYNEKSPCFKEQK